MNVYNITPESFIAQVVEAYKHARIAKVDNVRITRGRSHSISSYIEDLLAAFLAENLAKYQYLIDQPITIKGRKNAIYPDIVLVDNDQILNLIDVKMDLGWNRNGFVKFCNDKEDLITNIRSKTCTLKDGTTKKSSTLQIHADAKYHIVLISDTNIPKKQMKVNIEGTMDLKNVCVYVLTSNQHPNTYDEEKLKQITVNTAQFDRLIDNLK